jgi:hypothetical protein
MQLRLRTYTLRDGLEVEFIAKWNEVLAPMRRQTGFDVLGAWYDAERSTFTWLVGWPGAGSYDEAEQAYYDSPLRAEVTWAPDHFITDVEVRAVESVMTKQP